MRSTRIGKALAWAYHCLAGSYSRPPSTFFTKRRAPRAWQHFKPRSRASRTIPPSGQRDAFEVPASPANPATHPSNNRSHGSHSPTSASPGHVRAPLREATSASAGALLSHKSTSVESQQLTPRASSYTSGCGRPWIRPGTWVSAVSPILSFDQAAYRLDKAVRLQETNEIYAMLRQIVWSTDTAAVDAWVWQVPRTTITALYQSLDPVKFASRMDCTDGLRIPERLQEYSPVPLALDRSGIAQIFKELLSTLTRLTSILKSTSMMLNPLESQVMLRCAGAACDQRAALDVFNESFLGHWIFLTRPTPFWTEFMAAMHLTRPLYLHNDLARTRIRGHVYNRLNAIDPIRLKSFRDRNFAYGSDPSTPTLELDQILHLPNAFRQLYGRAQYLGGVVMDEEQWNTGMIASGRMSFANSLKQIVWGIRKNCGIILDRDKTVRSVPEAANVVPSPRMLHGIVHSLGNMACVSAARNILLHLSDRRGVKIPAAVWSDLLSFAYIFSEKQAHAELDFAKNMARREGKYMDPLSWVLDDDNSSGLVINLVKTMVSPPHNVELTFEDLEKYIKALIAARRFDEARVGLAAAVRHYHHQRNKDQQALLETLYPEPHVSASDHLFRAKAEQHCAWYVLMRMCARWVERVSLDAAGSPETASRTIPDFVREFKEFMPSPVMYYTSSGKVIMRIEERNRMFRFKKRLTRSPTTTVRILPEDPLPAFRENGPPICNPATGQVQRQFERQKVHFKRTRTVRVRQVRSWEKGDIREQMLVRKTGKGPKSRGDLHSNSEAAAEFLLW